MLQEICTIDNSTQLRAFSEMAGGVAHDLNNILSTILGRTQLALEDAQDERVIKSLRIIKQAASDGAEVVRSFGDITRPRDNHDFDLVDLNQLVEDTLPLVEHRRNGDVDISVDLNKIDPVHGDTMELKRALTNIVLNAIDAMPQGGRLTIKTHQEDGWVALSVSDNGIGIPAEVNHKIFDPFFTTKGSNGNGLGLSNVRSIVAEHGGKIEVDSSFGNGSTFCIRLPKANGNGHSLSAYLLQAEQCDPEEDW